MQSCEEAIEKLKSDTVKQGDINMDDSVEKLAKAISLIRKSLTCSVCLEVCVDPCTPRCGHPFCQQCIGKVMVKRSAQCPMCNGRLTRRTVKRNDQLGNMIVHFHKIESAIKADIHINIADYQIHPQSYINIKQKLSTSSTEEVTSRTKKNQHTDNQRMFFKKVNKCKREEKSMGTSSSLDKNIENPLRNLETDKIKNAKTSTEEAKKTWSRIRKFGKEMRPLKKKSLNVSIESKSLNASNFAHQKISSAEVNSQDIFASVSVKKPTDLVPENKINVPSDEVQKTFFEKEKSVNLKQPDDQVIASETIPKVGLSSSDRIFEDSNSKEQRENLFVKSSRKRSFDFLNSENFHGFPTSRKPYEGSQEESKSILVPAKIPSTAEVLLEDMDITLAVNSVETGNKCQHDEMNRGVETVEIVAQSSIPGSQHLKELKKNLDPNNRNQTLNLQSTSTQNSDTRRLSSIEVPDIKLPQVQFAGPVPFKKLGRIFKRQRRIPFYYLGKLSQVHNLVENSKCIESTLKQCEKNGIKMLSTTNLSDSGFNRTRANLSEDISNVNNSMHRSRLSSSGTVNLLSPQNDSQLKHLSIGSPHKESVLSTLRTSCFRGKDNVENFENSINSEENSFTHIEQQVNIVENFESLREESQDVNKKELIGDNVIQNQYYKKLLEGSDLNINTAQFDEIEDISQHVLNNQFEVEVVEEQKEPKICQDSDSESIVPCSLDISSQKRKLELDFLLQSSNSTKRLPHPGTSQGVETDELADRFFGDLIEKSKHIRENNIVNILKVDSENSKENKLNCETEQTRSEKSVSILPNGLKTPIALPTKTTDINLGSDRVQVADGNLDMIKNTPKRNKNVSKKVFSDENSPDFSVMNDVGSITSEVLKPLVQPSVKRKSCPLYHSTPKVQKTKATSQRFATSLNLSSQKPDNSTADTIFEKSVSAKTKLSFVCSGLSISQIESVKKLSKLVNADFVSTFNPSVTHVIVKVTGQQNATEKTLKYLQGIAYGKWIVSVKWAFDSLQESKLLNEEKYEAVDNLTLEEGPKKARLRKKGIFEGFTCLCQGPFNDVSVEDYSDLLIHTGARIVTTMDDLAADNKKLKIIVVQPDYWDEKVLVEWFKTTKAVPVEHEWIVECISQYKLISLLDYLQGIMPQDANAVGFPEELLAEGSDCEYED